MPVEKSRVEQNVGAFKSWCFVVGQKDQFSTRWGEFVLLAPYDLHLAILSMSHHRKKVIFHHVGLVMMLLKTSEIFPSVLWLIRPFYACGRSILLLVLYFRVEAGLLRVDGQTKRRGCRASKPHFAQP